MGGSTGIFTDETLRERDMLKLHLYPDLNKKMELYLQLGNLPLCLELGVPGSWDWKGGSRRAIRQSVLLVSDQLALYMDIKLEWDPR